MPAKTPEEICGLFKSYMAEGNLDGLLSLYDPEAVFVTQSGDVTGDLRKELAPMAVAHAVFDFHINKVVRSGDIALMHTDWKVSSPQEMSVYAIEVARRQSDGTWRWLIGDPFTVSKR